MRKWIFSRSIILLLIAGAFLAHGEPATKLCLGFAPPNSLWIPDQAATASGPRRGLSHAQFDEILDRITAEYKDVVARAGGTLKIERKWSNGTVNAYAYRDGRAWLLSMFGGMARYPLMTYDGFVSVACHELGHHLGGLPKFNRDWASVEGESDYYAALKCMRRIFAHDDNQKIVASRPFDATAEATCAREYGSQQDQLICQRVAQAGVEIGAALADMDHDPAPRILTPVVRAVKRTFQSHPLAQCRLDTYYQGALCKTNPWDEMSNLDPYRAACPTNAEFGARPRCWFKP